LQVGDAGGNPLWYSVVVFGQEGQRGHHKIKGNAKGVFGRQESSDTVCLYRVDFQEKI
jgi:hypothetical protein